ncbi:hypothetical protein GCM10010197_10390 [Nocardioides luteus]|uniref:PsbP C-terminal domain-containing protein n=2 Tax=Nocardioides luteus TaxID=1844 RepID=A0ABQ5SZA9_9ACTN|nr:hypothetical protein GCM10010197_10390 [Nocardioides luteus]GLJ68903.1 hypothetical protein GCM10017579_29390 [Nocardioides luteus]
MTAPSSGGAASPEPTDPGAGWHGVESDGVQLKAPPAWDVRMEDGVHYVLSTPKDEQGFRDGFATLMTGSTLAASTDELASTSRESVIGDYSDVERLDDVQFRGTKFFHIQATGESRTYDLYGALLDGGTEVSVHWSFAGETSRKKIDKYINEVMATFKFAG